MGSSGCGLCADMSAQEKLTPVDLEVIRELLNSVDLHINIDTTTRETPSSDDVPVFCEVCRNLLQETSGLHALLQMVTSQLDSVLAKVKVKYEGKSVHLNVEENNCDTECWPSQMEVVIGDDPLCEVEESVWLQEDDAGDPLSTDEQFPNETEEEEAVDIPQNGNLGADSFPCVTCHLHFPSQEEKFLHDETIHFSGASDDVEGLTLLYSSICGKPSKIPKDLSTHNESFHSSHLKFLCLSCVPMRKFISEDLLKAHAVIHSSSPFSCCLCSPNSLSFEVASELDSHLLRLHTHSIKSTTDSESRKVGSECYNPLFPQRSSNIAPTLISSLPNGKDIIERFDHTYVSTSKPFRWKNNFYRKNACQFCTKKFQRPCKLKEHMYKFHEHLIEDEVDET